MLLHESLAVNGKLTLCNRLVLPPMDTELSDPQTGKITDELLAYYEERIRGGHIGLVILEHCFIAPEGRANPRQVSLADDSVIEPLRRLTDIAHAHGTAIIAQLSHAGSMASPTVTGIADFFGPSAIVNSGKRQKNEGAPREMTKEEILVLEEQYAQAARRAKAAGFDGVELHSAHSYMLNQFYSPLTNCRTDEYGGDLTGRLRIHMETLTKVRRQVGEDCLVAVRLGGSDYMAGGNTIDDAVESSRRLEAAGVDLLDLSGGMCRYLMPDRPYPGYFSDMSSAVKAAVSVPVLLTGGITEAAEAERLLAEGAADLIGVGRAMMKDPRWAEKAMAE